MIGVFWNAPGKVSNSFRGCSSGFHSQATFSRATLSRVMAVSGEYLVPPGSPP